MFLICAAVAFRTEGTVGSGFIGRTKGIVDTELYCASEKVRRRRPCYPSPRLLNMDAAFAFSCTWRSLMVSYDGRPMIGSTVRWEKPAVILLISSVGIFLGWLGGMDDNTTPILLPSPLLGMYKERYHRHCHQ